MATPAPPEDQARLLEDALVAVRQQTSVMRKCLETPGKLMDALKCWYDTCLGARYAASASHANHCIVQHLSPSFGPVVLVPSNTTSFTCPSSTPSDTYQCTCAKTIPSTTSPTSTSLSSTPVTSSHDCTLWSLSAQHTWLSRMHQSKSS